MNYAEGAQIIKNHAATLPDTPGVYRMLGEDDKVLYVGKARALKRRVISYTQVQRLSARIMRMVSQTKRMEFVHTHTEVEALLLEANLIKKLKPKYNVLLRDDKSFPYIRLRHGHDFPQVEKYRGAVDKDGDYFGPFASVVAVNETIATLQKAFMLRNCSDNVFAARTRPCLQYHIKRCTAPCVGYVDKTAYEAQVDEARRFLSGQSREMSERFAELMGQAAARMEYEEAAKYRDKIRALAHVQLKQDINVASIKEADVFAIMRDGADICVQVFFFRDGQNFGNKAYFPTAGEDEDEAAILAAFIPQFYVSRVPPLHVLCSHMPNDATLIDEALQNLHKLKRGVHFGVPERGERKRVLDFVLRNAAEALSRHKLVRAGDMAGLARVQEIFELDELPQRIEVYDNSHIQGTNKVGGMIVGGPEGLRKSAYRKFNIKTVEDGDDFAMMREVMERRFKRAIEEGEMGDAERWPALLLIDGGQGQLSSVMEILERLGVADALNVVAISKGPDRNAGREWFHRVGHAPIQLPFDDVGLQYMQRLRDEAHRFAIGTHRAKRGKAMVASVLDEVPGIGPARKKALLRHFGSGKAVQNAGLADLQAVEGISRAVAQRIYAHFHGS